MPISRRTLAAATLLIFYLTAGCTSDRDTSSGLLPGNVIKARADKQQLAREAIGTQTSKQILFGDLHVHTTYSPDAFIMAMPLMGGDGLHPPADACDFARYCSALDFWSINDHAEGITPARWMNTKEAIRACNAAARDTAEPDLVAFLGWEWTQIDPTPENYYGHKNVILLDTAENRVPTRPIAAPRKELVKAPIGKATQFALAMMDWSYWDYYVGLNGYYEEISETPICPDGVDTRDLPANCLELAARPSQLFDKLRQWDYDNIVIPHGTMNAPPNATFDQQLNLRDHDPATQLLFEVFSGHGSSEEYFSGRAVGIDAAGAKYCPQSTEHYLPCCQRAGQIIRARCENAGLATEECQAREVRARQNYVDAGVSGHLTVPGQQVSDWLNCGQCPDCFTPAMNLRPGTTAQYALAKSNFDAEGRPLRYRFGLIGSSDNHAGRAGTGYKEYQRKAMTEVTGRSSSWPPGPNFGDEREPVPYSVALKSLKGLSLGKLRNTERKSSFYLTGGLVAAHSDSRRRESIWGALKSKEVYATSGDRILLWFNLVNTGETLPMGSETSLAGTPHFQVKAVGAREQLPGCPQHSYDALGAERLDRLCRSECYNPGDTRKLITRIEVIRIRPQATPNEDIQNLVEDPWLSIECPPDPKGCNIEFTDPDFEAVARDTLYYVRALQAPSLAVNGGGLRCEYDASGSCIAVNPCYGDSRTPATDDCLTPVEERAWSSPIFVTAMQTK